MEARPVRLGFPFNGLSDGMADFDQSPETTPDCKNVVAYDPRTGQRRGAQRAGLSKYETNAIGSSPVQEIVHFAGPGFVNQFGNGHVVQPYGGSHPNLFDWQLLDRDGVVVVSRDIEAGATSFEMSCFDTDCNAYIAVARSGGTDIQFEKYDKDGAQQWSRTIVVNSTSVTNRRLVRGMFSFKNMIYVLFDGQGAYEGSIRRYHISDGTEVDASPFVAAVGNVAGTRTDITGDQSSWLQLNNRRLGWIQWDLSDFKVSLLLLNPDSGDTVTTIVLYDGTHGTNDHPEFYAIAVDGLGFFYVNFRITTGGATTGYVRKYDSDGTQVWEKTYTDNSIDHYGMAYLVDTEQVAIVGEEVYGTTKDLVVLSAADGATVSSHDTHGPITSVTSDGSNGLFITTDSSPDTLVRLSTDYETAIWTRGVSGISTEPLAACSRPVNLQTAIKRRYVRAIAVCGGTVRRFDDFGISGVVTVTSGDDALANQQVVFGTVYDQDVYFADGETTKFYQASTNSIKTWTPTAGELPIDGNLLRARLICTWQSRIVLAGLPGDPQNWFMSAADNPLDFDYSPAAVLQTQAVAGSATNQAKMGDVITSLCPFSEDVLIAGCDSSIWQFTGNPAAGGRYDQLSDITGMAWGRPWTRDPEGVVWFFGSRGGLYRLAPNSKPERVSLTNVDERLATLDMKTTIVRLAWDDRLVGIWITLTSTDLQTDSTHYFWDARNNAFFPFSFANGDHEPHVLHVFDGDDPGDRAVLLGCRDGFVRKFDPAATSDDGTAIDSYVLIGPIQSEERIPMIISELRCVLSQQSADVTWSLLQADTPEEAQTATAVKSGTFRKAGDRRARFRQSGQAFYLKLQNANNNESWALEMAAAKVINTSAEFARRY